MRKILFSIFSVGLVTAFAVYMTGAFFSDTETSQNNVLEAGELDLEIDNESYYNGVFNEGTSWELDNLDDKLFFNFTDLKPDDYGEDTISLHADNDYWACMNIKVTKDDDNTCTEPEKLDDPNCGVPDQEPNANLFDGELGGVLNFVWWVDDGDNVLEDGEKVFEEGNALRYFTGKLLTLSDSGQSLLGGGGPLKASQTYFIGKAWCFGTLGKSPLPQGAYDSPAGDNNNDQQSGTPEDGGYTCDGTALNNATQTDVAMGDIEFSAFQARHNPDFQCSPEEPSITPKNTPTPTLTLTPTPTLACGQADVMLVLDRSGSISSTELGQLKTAAKDFVDALGLTLPGTHAGFSSFNTFGSLNQHLTDDSTAVKNEIDLLTTSAGPLSFTNLKEGIDLAVGELDDTHLAHERPAVDDKMIVITDGHPNRPLPSDTADDVAEASADAARTAGIDVFVVGIGSDVDAAYLQTIADDASQYYSVSDYSGLQAILQGLDLCK